MNKKVSKYLKLGVVLLIIVGFVWFLVIYPMKTFHENERELEAAAKRYFELNSSELPTGSRVKTVTLQQLYHKSFVKKDFMVPYSKKTCSVTNSWVKVKRADGDYKYYTYLECGALSSNVDHTGPVIKLNGDTEIVLGKGEEFKDSGIKSVIDDSDGKLKISDVTVKGEVDTSKVGTYEISYSAYDKLRNKGSITRVVKVVQKLNSTIKKDLNGTSNYTGLPTNNYIRISNMLFRIFGIDSNNNVIVVSNYDVSNVNYSKLDKWLDYYYDHLNENSKKLIVPSKFCNMDVTETTLDTTECTSYTKNKKVYIPSIIEVNKAAGDVGNFMRPTTMSWVSNKKSGSKEAYLTRNDFYEDLYGKTFVSFNENDNNGVRPMLVLKGETLITGGNGEYDNPYLVGDTKIAKGGSALNERESGEYFIDNGIVWRIIDSQKDGTTKAISINSIKSYDDEDYTYGGTAYTVFPDVTAGSYIYNPKLNGNIGYFINNSVSGFVNEENIVKHEISVPIYKKAPIYGEEVETKKYNVKLSAPNTYEMFSSKQFYDYYEKSDSYWLINSSKEKDYVSFVTYNGMFYSGKIDVDNAYGVRVVAYFKKNLSIQKGSGTHIDPYVIS